MNLNKFWREYQDYQGDYQHLGEKYIDELAHIVTDLVHSDDYNLLYHLYDSEGLLDTLLETYEELILDAIRHKTSAKMNRLLVHLFKTIGREQFDLEDMDSSVKRFVYRNGNYNDNDYNKSVFIPSFGSDSDSDSDSEMSL